MGAGSGSRLRLGCKAGGVLVTVDVHGVIVAVGVLEAVGGRGGVRGFGSVGARFGVRIRVLSKVSGCTVRHI